MRDESLFRFILGKRECTAYAGTKIRRYNVRGFRLRIPVLGDGENSA